MLPIGNRPLVDYIVQDCIAAGITEIYFIVSSEATQLRAYYERNPVLDEYLIQKGKVEQLAQVAPIEGVSFRNQSDVILLTRTN